MSKFVHAQHSVKSEPSLAMERFLEDALKLGEFPARAYADALHAGDRELYHAYQDGTGARALVRMRVAMVDTLLLRVWRSFFPESPQDISLVAVGGYGRQELQPHSDIDLMVLLADEATDKHRERIEGLLTFLWDMGLDIGHSVRTVQQCIGEARDDVTVATNLMEGRPLAGSKPLFEQMQQATGPNHIWPAKAFFQAKLDEQVRRHRKYHDTAYKLEPNIKESPGGLRDIQMIGWVAKRRFDVRDLNELVDHNFLSRQELERLNEGQDFLWSIRFLLHCLSGRREDRLLLDYQRELAHEFGYLDDENNLAVEQFMQRYYRTVMELERLNEMLLQLFQEAILYEDVSAKRQRLNKRFYVRKGFLEAAHPKVFAQFPPALLEVFLVYAQHPEIKGIRADTIRLIRDHRHLIDQTLRNDLMARNLFMEILRVPEGITHTLRRMNRYGVLAAYLPAFERIVGRMQYDLFHIYTVDEHILTVIRNLRRFAIPQHKDEFPLCSEIVECLPRHEFLYIAALFHDIAKGRGGDHSELGAEDAKAFCIQHGLKPVDTELVLWLVLNHLKMSITAQRKDISNPKVIHDFAAQVGSTYYLNHLYLLTVADIRGTNPDLWNSWRDNLLKDLYHKTLRCLRRGLQHPIDKVSRIREIKEEAKAQLSAANIDEFSVNNIWKDFGDNYFLRHTADEVAWHTQSILTHHRVGEPLVLIRQETPKGSTAVFVLAQDHDHLFALITTVLDRLGLNVVDARIITSDSGWALDTFLVLEDTGETIADPHRLEDIRLALQDALAKPDELPAPAIRNTPRKLKNFKVAVRLNFTNEGGDGNTAIEVIAADRPGLLSRIGICFLACGLAVHNAKIATVGERVDDVFFVTDRKNQPITDEIRLKQIESRLTRILTC